MSKELKNIAENVMNQIHQGKVKMKPKIYFVIGSILTFVGLVSSAVVSIFLVGLMRFSLRMHEPMSQYRLDRIVSDFPWIIVVFAVLGLVIGIWLIKQYDFSYKVKLWHIVTVFILVVFVSGWTIDAMGINDTLKRRGPMKGMMKKYFQENNIQISPDLRM